jgi:hypothetical protein
MESKGSLPKGSDQGLKEMRLRGFPAQGKEADGLSQPGVDSPGRISPCLEVGVLFKEGKFRSHSESGLGALRQFKSLLLITLGVKMVST